MKIKTHAQLILSLPYLCLIESLGYSIVYGFNKNTTTLETINSFWNFSAIFWFVPYTILAIYLLTASRNKTTDEIEAIYTFAPVMMGAITGGVYLVIIIIVLLIGLFFNSVSLSDRMTMSLGIWLVASVTTIVSFCVGAFIVIISLLLYKTLRKINLITE
jgi:hypothetical protein